MNIMHIKTINLNCTLPNCPDVSDFIDDHPLYWHYKIQNIVLICFYVPLFLIALIFNISIICVVNCYKSLKSVTNYFLVNLSMADLLVTLVCMPMAFVQATSSVWTFGNFMCKLTNYLQGVAVASGVFTITVMSLDRYMAICHPFSRRAITKQRSIKIILIIWILALILFAPIFFIRTTKGFRFGWDVESREFLYCVESWPDYLSQRYFGIFYFVAVYAIPGCIVVVAYSLIGLRLCTHQFTWWHNNNGLQVNLPGEKNIRERRHLAKVLLVLAFVFALCWLPYSVLTLILDLNSKPEVEDQWNTEANEGDENLISIATSLLPFSLLLGHLNSAVNPILCFFISKNFRSSIIDMVRQPFRALLSLKSCRICTMVRRDPHPSIEQIIQDNNQQVERPVCSPGNNHLPNSTVGRLIPANSKQSDCVEEIWIHDLPSLSTSLSCNASINLAGSGSKTNESYCYYHHVHKSRAITYQSMVVVQTVVTYTPNLSTHYCINQSDFASRLVYNGSGINSGNNHVCQHTRGRLNAVKHLVPNTRTCITFHKLGRSSNLLTESGKLFVMGYSRGNVQQLKILNTISEESVSYKSEV